MASDVFVDEDALARVHLTSKSSNTPRFNSPLVVRQPRGALSVNEFCRWAGVGRSKFYSEVKAGRIRLRKIGRKSVVTMADAESWLAALPEAE